jgi:hypothetical protein
MNYSNKLQQQQQQQQQQRQQHQYEITSQNIDYINPHKIEYKKSILAAADRRERRDGTDTNTTPNSVRPHGNTILRSSMSYIINAR